MPTGHFRKLLLGAFALSMATAIGASEPGADSDSTTPPILSFVARWNVGDTAVYRIRKTKIRRQADTLVSHDSSAYEAVLRVVSRDPRDSSLLIRWTYQNDLGTSYKLSEPLRRRLAKYDRIELEYRIGADGEFLGIVGWLRQSRMMGKMMDDVIEAMAEEKKTDLEAIRTTLKPVMDAYRSKEGLESVVFKEVRLVHFALGAEFEADSVLEYEDAFPNLFGGAPIPTRGTLRASRISPDLAALDQVSQADPALTRNMVLGLMRKMMPEDSVVKVAANMSLDLSDTNRFEIDLATGFPRRIRTHRKILVNIPGQRGGNTEELAIDRIR
jgi:hypothetical protein